MNDFPTHNKKDRIRRFVLKTLGITQAEYNKIIDRWDEFDMMTVPFPFVYKTNDPNFRAWSVVCLSDKRGRKTLEKIIGREISLYSFTGDIMKTCLTELPGS